MKTISFFLLLTFSAFADKLTVDLVHKYTFGQHPLWLKFSEPMIPLGYPADSVPQGLSLSPPVAGKWSWESQSTLVFYSDEKWHSGNIYTITIPAGVSSKNSGNRLKKEFKKGITVGMFSGSIYAMRSTAGYVNVYFDLPVHPDSLRRHLTCTYQPLQLVTSDSSSYRIKPQEGWKEGCTVTLSIDAGLTPRNGNMPLDSALKTSFNVSDTIRFEGLFRNDKKVSLSDTLYLEDRYELRFSHWLHDDALKDYALVNGKQSENIFSSGNAIDVNRFLVPGKPVSLLLKAGLPSHDSAFLFKDIHCTLIGDTNRLDPALPAIKINKVLVCYDEEDSIPPQSLSFKTPVRLLPKMKFDFVSEKPDTFLNDGWSLNGFCLTPYGKDTLHYKDHYLYPDKLPPNANCTLVVKAGYRTGGYQLKKDFLAIFHTGIREFPQLCRPIIKGWDRYPYRMLKDTCTKPHHIMLPVSPSVPLKCFGTPHIVTAIRPITKCEEVFPCDSPCLPHRIWQFDTIPDSALDSDLYKFIPIPLSPVLSEKGCGVAEVLLSVNGKKYDTLGRYVVTDLGMQLIKLRLSTAVIVTSLTKRLPVAGAEVTLVGEKYETIAQGVTDSSGFFQVPRPLAPNFIVVVTTGDTLIYRTEKSSFTDTTKCDGIIITERGLYCPGDTIFFKGIVRRLQDRWEPQIDDSAIVSIRWKRAGEFLDTLPLSGCGSFSGKILIPPEVVQQSYSISARPLHAEGRFYTQFKVTDFRPAELTTTLGKGIIEDDSVKIAVSAKWLHGGTAGKCPFTWECKCIPTLPSWLETISSRYGDILYDNYDYRWSLKNNNKSEKNVTGSAVLDATGRAIVSIARCHDDSGMTYQFSAIVEGSPVQTARAQESSVEISNDNHLYIGIYGNTTMYEGDTVPFLLKSVNKNGLAAKGVELRTTVIHNIPVRKYSKNRFGLPAVIRDTVHTKVRTEYPVTDSLGIVRLTTTTLLEGNYSVTAQPKNSSHWEQYTYDFTISPSNPEEKQDEYAYHDDEPTDSSEGFRIIEIDSGVHNVGDMVRFHLRAADDSCNVLLTVNRENTYGHQWITMTGRDTVITLTLRDEHIPAIKVEAAFFPPLHRTSGGLPSFKQEHLIKTVSVNTHISTESRHIPVTISTDHTTCSPGDSVTVNITIPQKSASATALVMVVDEGVLLLDTTSVPDITSAFSIDTNSVSNWSNECSIRNIYGPFDYDSCNALRLRGGEEKNDTCSISAPEFMKGGCLLGKEEKPIELRNSPQPCAYFNPEVKFDTDGKAVCRFKLPGNLTRWRITAIVDDTTSFGVDTTTFEANKPLMIRPQLPRFLRVGDSADAVYIVENRSKENLNINSGVITDGDTAIDTFALQNDDVCLCHFPLIGRETGTDSLLFIARSDTFSDGIKLGMPIIFERSHDVMAIGGSTTDSTSIPVILPEPVSIDSGNLELTLSTTRMQSLNEGVQYLFGYPYGCLEQQSSRILPLLLLGDFTERFHLPMLAKGDEPYVIKTYLNHIIDFQNKSDGGLGYWPSDSGKSSPWLTAFVLEIIIKAKGDGYFVNDSFYTKAFKYLKSGVHQEDPVRKRLFIDSYMQLVMTQAGKPDRSALQKLYKMRKNLPLSAQINLLRAMYIAGNFKRKVAVLQKLLQYDLVEKDRLACFAPEESEGFEFCHESQVRQTALALEALLETGSRSRFDEPMIRWLTGQCRNGRWRTTQENVAVFRAFAAYTNAYEHDIPKLNATVKLAGTTWFSAALEGREGIRAQASRPLDSMEVKGNTTVSINSRGNGRLYWDLLMSTYPAGNAPPVSSGISVTRTVLPVDTVDQPQFVQSNLQIGRLLKVTVNVHCNRDITFVAINDPIPAGCEVINPELKTGEQQIALKNTQWKGPSRLTYYEFRDSRILLFTDNMVAGDYQFSYILKPTTAGTFFWPAPYAEAMYYPEFYGRGVEARVNISGITIQPHDKYF